MLNMVAYDGDEGDDENQDVDRLLNIEFLLTNPKLNRHYLTGGYKRADIYSAL